MTDRPFDPNEEQFLRETGIGPRSLESLVMDAPALPDDLSRRIRARVHAKVMERRAPAPRSSHRWAAAVAAGLIALAGTAVAASPALREQLAELVYLIPGIGLSELAQESLVLSKAIPVPGSEGRVTVTGVISDGAQTLITLDVRLGPGRAAGNSDEAFRKIELIKPGGGRLMPRTIRSYTSDGVGQVTLNYPALPGGTRSFELGFPVGAGVTNAESVDVSLVPTGEAPVRAAVATPAVTEGNGLKLRVPYISTDGELIRLRLEVEPASAEQTVIGVDRNHLRYIRLMDDQGREYPLVSSRSRLGWLFPVRPSVPESHAPPYEVVFTGPLGEGVRSLTLKLSGLLVAGEGQAQFRLPLAEMVPDQAVSLNQTLSLGSHTVTVRQATRQSDGQIRLELDMGGERDGISLAGISMGDHVAWESAPGGLRVATLPIPRGSGSDLVLTLKNPICLVDGDWSLTVPLQP